MSEITQPRSIGITAQAANARTQLTSGASRNTPLLEPEGITGSFSTNFKRSAKNSAIRSRSLRCRQHLPGRQPGTFRHHRRGTRDRVGEIEVLDRTLERRL